MKTGTSTIQATVRRLAVAIATLGVALAIPVSAYAGVSVMIDPGHGGKDPGAVASGIVEKRVNLAISRAVAAEVRRQGWTAAMTRNNDRFVPLVIRPAKATSRRADVFVSIHANSTGKATKGAMTIYRSKQGRRLGAAIMSQLARLTPYKDIGNRSDVRGLAVLRAAKTPAVIVEVMSVTAPAERRKLKNPKVQKRIAQAIVRGIARYEGVRYKDPERKPAPAPVEARPTAGEPSGSAASPQTNATATAAPSRAQYADRADASHEFRTGRRSDVPFARAESPTERLVDTIARLLGR